MDIEYGGGVELDLFNIFKPRVGYRGGNDLNNLSAGMAIGYPLGAWKLGLDYAVGMEVEMTHLVELKIEHPAFFGVAKEDEAQRRAEEHFEKAQNYITVKDYENAHRELDAVVTLVPDHKEAYYEKGRIYYDQGNYRNSLENVRTAIKIDSDYDEARDIEDKIVAKFKKEKPAWLQEDKFYKKRVLVFEDFDKEAIISKFIAITGKFSRVQGKTIAYGKWQIDEDQNKNLFKTSIRLPDLSKFDGINLKIKSERIPRFDLILVEQTIDKERKWIIPVSSLKNKWKEVKIPFRYFKYKDDAQAKIDLKKIVEVQLVISETMQEYREKGVRSGSLSIDKVSFYKGK